MGHIRSYQIRYSRWNSDSFSSCFSPLPQLPKLSTSPTAQEPSLYQELRSRFQFPPQNASSSNQSTSNQSQSQLHAVNLSSQPGSKKSPNKNSLMPSPNVNNFRMSNLLIREINDQH